MSMLTLPGSARPKDAVPLKFGLLLYPGFQALDVFGPIDALNSLALLYPVELFILAETMEPVSTEIPSIMNTVGSKFAQSVVPTHTFANAPPIDVLIVPGGMGCSPGIDIQSSIDFIGKVFPSLDHLFTVCAGSGVAAQSGVLDGYRATTNKAFYMEIIKLRPEVKWVPQARWVADGKVWTSSGVAAGMDAMFAFIAEFYGAEVADILSDWLEYERHTDPSWDPYAKKYGLDKLQV